MLKVSIVPMPDNTLDLDIRKRIIEGAMQLFTRYGVRSVTMDDVAKEVSVSKKTLYLYFTNKDGLVTAVTHFHLELEKSEYTDISDHAENAIDELHQLASCMRKNVEEMNPSLIFDLQKFHHGAWDIYLQFKDDFIRGNVEDNLNRGIREGHYRKDLNAKILSKFRVEQVQMIFDQKIFPAGTYAFVEVQMHLFDHFIRGLLTDKGKALYENYLKMEVKSIST